MPRVAVFIDGFNLYHAVTCDLRTKKHRWLNLEKLARCFLTSNDSLNEIFYFTALAVWDANKVAKHKTYISALRTTSVQPILGAFRRKDKHCTLCRRQYPTYEEKRTDVNIAIKLFQTAIIDSWDSALIVSGDSDLIPAIEAVKKSFPSKQIGVVIPIGRRAEELKSVTDFHRKMKIKHLETSQFPEVIDLGGGISINKPLSWR